jgi:hypothetical protein
MNPQEVHIQSWAVTVSFMERGKVSGTLARCGSTGRLPGRSSTRVR